MPGGIIVRTACETSSQQLPERLQTNTVVKELRDLCRRCIVKQGVWPVWTNWKRKHAAVTLLYFNTCFSDYRFSCIFRLWLWEGFRSLADTTLLLYPCTALPTWTWLICMTNIMTSFHILWKYLWVSYNYTISCTRRCSLWVKDSTMSCWERVRVQATDAWSLTEMGPGDGERGGRCNRRWKKNENNKLNTSSVTEDTKNYNMVFFPCLRVAVHQLTHDRMG